MNIRGVLGLTAALLMVGCGGDDIVSVQNDGKKSLTFPDGEDWAPVIPEFTWNGAQCPMHHPEYDEALNLLTQFRNALPDRSE